MRYKGVHNDLLGATMKNFILITLLLLTGSVNGQERQSMDSLTRVLEGVLKTDQELRRLLPSVEKEHDFSSVQKQELLTKITLQDSINRRIVTSFLDRYGWLGASETSSFANAALFLVIQHSDLTTQLKYLPMMKDAVNKGKARPQDLAYLIDRVNMSQGRFQIYGSQINGSSFFPIEDELNVNSRRKSVGLDKIEDYAKSLNISYTTPKKDYLKSKIVIMGNIRDINGIGLDSVQILWGNNKLVAQTDKGGNFKVVTEKSFVNWALIFRRKGYLSASSPLDNGVNVFGINYRLRKK